MPNTISVSPAVPDKLVVNGVDLVNRQQLSTSQNRELQRYIDANAHLLGYLNKDKEGSDAAEGGGGAGRGNFDSFSLDRYSGVNSAMGDLYPSSDADLFGSKMSAGTAAAAPHQQRMAANSPTSSEYDGGLGGKGRKGVSWSDIGGSGHRARSHSPPGGGVAGPQHYPAGGDVGAGGDGRGPGAYRRSSLTNYDPSPYASAEQRRGPDDYDPFGTRRSRSAAKTSGAPSPAGGASGGRGGGLRMEHGKSGWGRWGQDGGKEPDAWKGFQKSDVPTYTAIERHPDDYYRFKDTVRSHSHERLRSQERDDTIKFYGYGDHHTSGIELKPKHWTGGERVTDPNYIRQYTSIKPRKLFYSPIGDGVVAADGVELKRGLPDLTPKVTVRHERFIEQDRGRPGHRLYERLWDEGGGGLGAGDDDGGGRGAGPKWPADDYGGDRGPRRPPREAPRAYTGPWPDDGGDRGPYQPYPRDDDSLGPPRSGSALSIGTDGLPREGWTKTWIANPRELINQYANETPTSIFDLKDHTPRTITTTKESIISVPGSSPLGRGNDDALQ